MGRKSFPGGAVLAPVPPVLVTVSDGEKTNVLTVGWCGILATVPPRTYVSVRPSRYSYEILKRGGEFVINLATASMAREVDYIGIYTGKKVDKFKKCNLTLTKSEKVTPPTIVECPIAIECRVTEVIPMGSHDVFLADIVGFTADEGIIDEGGRLDFAKADLLAYSHGEYFSLGEKLGSFGFSTKKGGADEGAKNSARASANSAEKATVKSTEGGAKAAKASPEIGKKSGTKNVPLKDESERKPFYEDFIKRGKKRR